MMRHKLFLSVMVLAFGAQMMGANLVLVKSNGQQEAQNVAAIGKWVYVGNDLQLISHDGEVLAQESVLEIRKIVFAKANTSTSPENAGDKTIYIYPNPTQDILMVENAQGDVLRLYSMDGRLVVMQAIENGSAQVDMAELPTGNYLLLSGNQSFQVIKQ